MSQRLRRFLHLEKPRRAPAGTTAPSESERFAGVEPPVKAEPQPRPASPTAADRFRAPRERPLDITERQEDAQPFARCAGCEMDNTVYATTCQNCGADLTTAEQRSFNQALWARRREESSREDAEAAARELARQQMASDEVRARRALVEELARREGQRVRDELEGTSGGWSDDPGSHTPWGIRLLGLLPHPLLRIATGVAAVGLPLLFILLGGRKSGLRLVGLLILVVLAVLFSPNHRYYRHRRWWWWS